MPITGIENGPVVHWPTAEAGPAAAARAWLRRFVAARRAARRARRRHFRTSAGRVSRPLARLPITRLQRAWRRRAERARAARVATAIRWRACSLACAAPSSLRSNSRSWASPPAASLEIVGWLASAAPQASSTIRPVATSVVTIRARRYGSGFEIGVGLVRVQSWSSGPSVGSLYPNVDRLSPNRKKTWKSRTDEGPAQARLNRDRGAADA